jgi:hypothetical protein
VTNAKLAIVFVLGLGVSGPRSLIAAGGRNQRHSHGEIGVTVRLADVEADAP